MPEYIADDIEISSVSEREHSGEENFNRETSYYYKTNYYQKYKENLWKEAHERYQNLSDEEKQKRQKSPETVFVIFPDF